MAEVTEVAEGAVAVLNEIEAETEIEIEWDNSDAAVGTLATLHQKRAIDTAVGSFLGRRRSCRGPPSRA